MSISRLFIVDSMDNEKYQSIGADGSDNDLLTLDRSGAEVAISSLSADSMEEIKIAGFVPDENILAMLYRVLKPKGKLIIHEILDREMGQTISVDLKIQGFMDVLAAKDPSSNDRFVVCSKPKFESEAIAKINISTVHAPLRKVGSVLAMSDENKKWKMDESELNEDDIIDEDQLVDDFSEPISAGCGDQLEPGKKRACKNCSCGLAEQEAAEVESNRAASNEVKTSSCGSCYKGDAFRCAQCPFLGKPAFEPGNEKVVLSMGDDF